MSTKHWITVTSRGVEQHHAADTVIIIMPTVDTTATLDEARRHDPTGDRVIVAVEHATGSPLREQIQAEVERFVHRITRLTPSA